jgi:hypothetical protein
MKIIVNNTEMKNRGGKRCYYCGGIATSGEHIPPKQMFKAFHCDSLTVPSCDDHNSNKSGRDQAIVSALLLPLHTGRNRHPLEPEIERAIELAHPSFERAKRSAIRTPFLKDPPKGLEDLPDLAHLVPSVNMAAWIRQLTAGLIYSGIDKASTTIKWSESIVWSPDWFPTGSPVPVEHADVVPIIMQNQEKRSALDALSWQPGWSAQPNPYPEIIYSFQVHVFPDKQVMIRHKFYNRYAWYVQFKASNKSISKLLLRLREP